MSHPTYCSDGACTQGEHATSIPIGLNGTTTPARLVIRAKHGGQRDAASGARNDRARIRRVERERRTVQRKRIKAGLPPDAAPPMGPVVTTWQDAALISWWLDHGGLAALVGQ
jgi:hypothetical protein